MIADLEDLEAFTIFVADNYYYDKEVNKFIYLANDTYATFNEVLRAYNLQRS